jgi:uncharacterized protein (DUF1778 family)
MKLADALSEVGRIDHRGPNDSLIAQMCGLCETARMTMRLVLEVTPDQRRQVKTLAAFAGMSMKDYVLSRALGDGAGTAKKKRSPSAVKVVKGQKPTSVADETDYLLSSPAMAKRLKAAMKSKASNRVSFNDVAAVRHALGI